MKQIQDELEASNYLLNLAQELGQLGHWHINMLTQEVFWSDQIYKIHGVHPDTYKPKLNSAIDFYHPEDKPIVEKMVQEALQNRSDFEFELRIVRPTGEIRYVSSKSRIEYNFKGEAVKIFGVFLDVTDQKRSEYEKLDQEQRYKAIFENSIDGIITISQDGAIESFNATVLTMFGYEDHELLGNNIKMLMPEYHASRHDGYLERYLKTGLNTVIGSSREVEGLKKNGELIPLELSVSEVPLLDKTIYCGSLRDVSESKKAKSELQKSNKELEDFAYIASHDLKEPLRGLNNHIYFLLKDYAESFDESAQKRFSRIKLLTKHMESLINDLLYYSRLGRVDLGFEKINFEKVIKEVEETLFFEDDKILIVDNALPSLNCDKVRVRELLRNLVANGLKYNDKELKEIHIGYFDECQGKKNVFYVKDNGIGIDEQFYDVIFGIFKRLHNKDEYGGGTGSGLTIVKKIVERHNGEIWLDSKPGKYSIFYFTLPQSQPMFKTEASTSF